MIRQVAGWTLVGIGVLMMFSFAFLADRELITDDQALLLYASGIFLACVGGAVMSL